MRFLPIFLALTVAWSVKVPTVMHSNTDCRHLSATPAVSTPDSFWYAYRLYPFDSYSFINHVNYQVARVRVARGDSAVFRFDVAPRAYVVVTGAFVTDRALNCGACACSTTTRLVPR